MLDLDMALTGRNNCDFLLISEHWQQRDNVLELKLRNFSFCCGFCRERMKHGGVAIFKSDSFQSPVKCLNLSEFCIEGSFECAGLVIDHLKICIIVIYRPPCGDFSEFLKLFDCILNVAFNTTYSVVIGGDFNINFLTPSFNLSVLLDLISMFNMTCTIDTPTRVTRHSSTCIDNFIVCLKGAFNVAVVNLSLSDHYAQFLNVQTSDLKNTVKKSFITTRNFCPTNVSTFLLMLEQEDWSDVYLETCPDNAWNVFFRVLSYYFEVCFAIIRKQVNKENKNKLYDLNPELLRLKEKVTLFNDMSKKDPKYGEISNFYSIIYREKLKLNLRDKNDQAIINSENKSKTMWGIINYIQKRVKHNTIEMFDNDERLSDETVANNFSNHFNFTPNRNMVDYEFLQKNVPVNENTFFMSPVCSSDVVAIINSLKNSGSSGFDGVSNNLIKKCKYLLCDVLVF